MKRDAKVLTFKGHKQINLIVRANLFYVDGASHKLVCFQNINKTLDENDSAAWRRLLEVMTHEIMNSIAPISSLANTLTKMLQASNTNIPTLHQIDDIKLGIHTIKRRSDGLLRFTNGYRNFNNVPIPELRKLSVRPLFENIENLMASTFQEKNIRLEISLSEPSLLIYADINLMEQVLINLLLNAMQSFQGGRENGTVKLSGAANKEKEVTIKVIDNGAGMSDELLDKIVIPFFTTRQKGSGIGLSLCKQIALLHSGDIQVQSSPDIETTFSINFPAVKQLESE